MTTLPDGYLPTPEADRLRQDLDTTRVGRTGAEVAEVLQAWRFTVSWAGDGRAFWVGHGFYTHLQMTVQASSGGAVFSGIIDDVLGLIDCIRVHRPAPRAAWSRKGA